MAAKLFHKAGEEAVKGCIEAHVNELFSHILHNIGTIVFALRHGSLFGGVDYSGSIVFLGGYDPFGNVYKAGEVATANALPQFKNEARLGEQLRFGRARVDLELPRERTRPTKGSKRLQEGHEPFGACFANPFSRCSTRARSKNRAKLARCRNTPT